MGSFTIGGSVMHPMLNIAVRAARVAGSIIVRGFENRDDLVKQVKGANDYVTQIDKEAEMAIIHKIKQSYPEHSFLGEESGETAGESTEFQWIIDPLDGTTNFIKGEKTGQGNMTTKDKLRLSGRTQTNIY